MRTAEEMAGILRETDGSVRILHFGALLAAEAGLGSEGLIVVGGSAIEIYTSGGYVTGDIDVVAEPIQVLAVLKRWEFKASGRMWYQEDWRIAVDIVRNFYSGSREHTKVFDTPYGSVRVASIEDVMVKRLISARFWEIPDDYRIAEALAKTNPKDIDWEYAEEIAKRDLVSDLLKKLRAEIGLSAN
jgi:hypothetical protein